jgi:ParB/RepB/Spo0J family partition protein
MRISLDKIVTGKYRVRTGLDREHVEEIKTSFQKDGQWDPIQVANADKPGYYDLVSGEHRYVAAQEIGWKDIEATVKDIDPSKFKLLALKANLFGTKAMIPMEEGVVLKEYQLESGLTQEEIAEEVGRSQKWVGERIALAMNISEAVKKALSAGAITQKQALIISQLVIDREGKDGKKTKEPDETRQDEFLKVLLSKQGGSNQPKYFSDEDTREMLHWYMNDTLYTIGYAGKDIKSFIKALQEAKIEKLFDIRDSTRSVYKLDFSGENLQKALSEAKIEYVWRQDLGVPYVVRTPYIESFLPKATSKFGDTCFAAWYLWAVRGKKDKDHNVIDLIPELMEGMKAKRSCLMCEEATPKPTGAQKHRCHRDILASILIEYEPVDSDLLLRFKKRMDL